MFKFYQSEVEPFKWDQPIQWMKSVLEGINTQRMIIKFKKFEKDEQKSWKKVKKFKKIWTKIKKLNKKNLSEECDKRYHKNLWNRKNYQNLKLVGKNLLIIIRKKQSDAKCRVIPVMNEEK